MQNTSMQYGEHRSNNDDINSLKIKEEILTESQNNSVNICSPSSTSTSESELCVDSLQAIQVQSDSESESSPETNYDERIQEKEKNIREVEMYIENLKERKSRLVDECDKLKERKALRRSNSLAKKNWENDTFPWNAEINKTLKNVFKLSLFRSHQLQTINAVMSKHDVLFIAPTGGGKSLCYQLPAVINQGVTIVVSPLLSLMEDQVWSLKNLGIEADYLSATTDRNKTNAILKILQENSDTSLLKLLYVTPERLAKSKRFLTALQKAYFAKKLNMIAIDEVHCCSQWGHDFRPDYKFMGALKQMFPEVPLLGVTATATSKVILDVQKMLHIRDCLVLKAPFNRPNLYYHVMEKPAIKEEVYNLLSDLLKNRYAGKSGIIYTFSIKDSEDLAAELIKRDIQARPYHANLNAERRTLVHKKWLKGLIQVVVGTVAFGMGIDKPDVRFVIHHTMSKSMENFYQESGRAGRDGKRAECILLYRFVDLAKITTMMFSERTGLQNAYAMADFCIDASRCRREIISQYFTEVWNDSNCNQMCDRCYHIKCVKIPKINITNYILDLYRILENAEAIDVIMTGTKLIDAWYKKGPTNLRAAAVEVPAMDRYWAEQIIAFMLLEKYLKEDFHFTAYNTISYVRKGPNVPQKDDILFHGARVLKLPECDDVWSNGGSSKKKASNVKGDVASKSKQVKKRSLVGNAKRATTSNAKKPKTQAADASRNSVRHQTPSTSSNKLTVRTETEVVGIASKRLSLLERERIIGSNKKALSSSQQSDDVIFIPDEENIIEIDD